MLVLGHGVALRVPRGPDQVGLELVELELRGLADDLGGALGVLHARELDRDLVLALLADLGLGDAELVDPLADDRDRAVEVRVGQLTAGRRLRLQHDLEPALEVEAELRLLVERRAGDRQQGRADDRDEDCRGRRRGWSAW